MIKTSNIFRYVCATCALLLAILVSSPLVTLAFEEITTMENQDKSTSTKPKPSKQFIMTETAADIPLDLPLYDKYTYSERTDQGLPTELPAIQPYYGEKIVYLTFDDGPDPENTPKVLEILKQHDIKATFFVTGISSESHPEILKQMYDEGHAIGNHSYNHNYRELYKSSATYFAQLQHNDDIIKKIIGVRPRISRAPGGTVGSFTKEYWDVAKAQGYVDISWNISSGDATACAVRAQVIVANVARQIENKALWGHAIVLMHDGGGHSETVNALPEIIQLFKDRGFEFKVVNIQTPPAW